MRTTSEGMAENSMMFILIINTFQIIDSILDYSKLEASGMHVRDDYRYISRLTSFVSFKTRVLWIPCREHHRST